MTSTNSPWTSNKPFLLKPVGKDNLWGGNRLNTEFAKGIPMEPLAETWECSTHPDGPSVIASGEYTGMGLDVLLKMHPEYLGTHPKTKGELPILIKFIDADKDLSVQVHPDDTYAMTHENGQLGKSELWYVLDAQKDASIIYGFRTDISKQQLQQSVESGEIEHYMNRVPISRDDVFFVQAGTVHGIGAGALIAEIQENSNLTYRLYDYNRTDKNENKRPLHVEKALSVANLNRIEAPRQPLRTLQYRKGCASELISRCQYFQVERLLLNTERCRELVRMQTQSTSFEVLLCTSGCGMIQLSEGESLCFFKGDCIFYPANSIETKLHGNAQFLRVRC